MSGSGATINYTLLLLKIVKSRVPIGYVRIGAQRRSVATLQEMLIMKNIALILFCAALGGPCLAADSYSIALVFPTRTVEGNKCSDVEFRIRPQFGITVAECALVSQSCPTSLDIVPSLGYENAVRLDAVNIYTECQFIEVERTSIGGRLLFACIDTLSTFDSKCGTAR